MNDLLAFMNDDRFMSGLQYITGDDRSVLTEAITRSAFFETSPGSEGPRCVGKGRSRQLQYSSGTGEQTDQTKDSAASTSDSDTDEYIEAMIRCIDVSAESV